MVMMMVRTEDGMVYYIEVELGRNSRLKRLREKIEEVTDIPKTHQKVIFCHPLAFDELLQMGNRSSKGLRRLFSRLLLCRTRRHSEKDKMFAKQIVHLTISHVRF
jgi:hypothetical protein